jgi:hypothetical protein
MTTTPISAVFFDSPDHAARTLSDRLRETTSAADIHDRLGRTSDAVLDEVATVTGEILEMSVGSIFENTWSKYSALVQAAEETAGDPDAVRLIGLVTHDVSVAYDPRVEVYLGDRRIATVPVQLKLTLTLRGALVHIRNGHLTGFRAGGCEIKGTLSLSGQPIASGKKTFDLAHDLQLPTPIRLAAKAAA